MNVKYVRLRMTRKQSEQMERALRNVQLHYETLYCDTHVYKWEDEAIWRLRSHLINALMEPKS